MKKILLFFLLTFNTVLFAQYTGGIADGYSKSNAPGFYRFDLADFIPILLIPSNNEIINSETVNFYWVKSPVSNVSRFQLSSDSSFTNIILDSLLENENLSVLLTSGFNRLCFWRVRAYDSMNITPWSEVSKFTVLMMYSGGSADGFTKNNTVYYCHNFSNYQPSLISPANGIVLDETTIAFNWVPAFTSEEYLFQIATDSSFTNLVYSRNLRTNSAIVNNLDNFNKQYYWRVQANDSVNTSLWSETHYFTVLKMYSGGSADGYASLKNEPENINNFVQKLSTPLNSEEINDLTPTFDWIYFWGSTSFHIQISLDSNFSNVIFDEEFLLTSELELEEGILNWNNVYFWRVRTFIDSLYSPWSEVWSFSTELDSLEINLSAGWNTVSSFYTPYISNLFDIFSNLNEQVKVIKNEMGQIYVPALGINQIGDWNVLEGYQLYVTEGCRFFISGEAITPDNTPLELTAGWHLVSYLRSNPMSIVTALQSISGSMLFAKNGKGDIYHPTYGINNIGDMIPGQGYWIYLTAPAVLTYPEN